MHSSSKDHHDVFHIHRDTLIGIAYRITGSSAEAEDIAQECLIRWHATDQSKIENPQAWLCTVATRLALDFVKSASQQRQAYVGPWLPEPLIAMEQQPEHVLELDQSVSMALMVLLDQLSPGERAAYILHDLFHFSFKDIAAMLGHSQDACRKLASRSREKIRQDGDRELVDVERHQRLMTAFFAATRQADTEQLVQLLAEEVSFHSDGGGKAIAARRIIYGRTEVAAWIIRVLSKSFRRFRDNNAVFRVRWFNGAPGLIIWDEGIPVSAFNFAIGTDGIRHIHVLRNPDKLRAFAAGACGYNQQQYDTNNPL